MPSRPKVGFEEHGFETALKKVAIRTAINTAHGPSFLCLPGLGHHYSRTQPGAACCPRLVAAETEDSDTAGGVAALPWAARRHALAAWVCPAGHKPPLSDEHHNSVCFYRSKYSVVHVGGLIVGVAIQVCLVVLTALMVCSGWCVCWGWIPGPVGSRDHDPPRISHSG